MLRDPTKAKPAAFPPVHELGARETDALRALAAHLARRLQAALGDFVGRAVSVQFDAASAEPAEGTVERAASFEAHDDDFGALRIAWSHAGARALLTAAVDAPTDGASRSPSPVESAVLRALTRVAAGVCSAVLWDSDSGRAPTIHAVQAPDRSAAGFVRLSFTVGDRAAAGLEVVLGEEQARRAVRSSARVRRKLPLAALRGIRVPVVCCLAEVRLPLREIGSLSVGDLITLDDAQLDTVLIRAGGRPAFRGDAGIQGSRIAVRITAVEGAADAPKPPQPGIALGERALPPAPARPGESRPQGESS